MAVVFSHLSLVFFPYLHGVNQSGLPNYDFLYFLHHSPFTFLYAGNAAVYIFFVLSGFVLSYAILKPNTDIKKKVISMGIKRYPRLAIPACFSVLIYWLAFKLNLDMSNATVWIARLGSQQGSLLDALYDGTTRSFIFGKSNYNWVIWTMQIELFGSFAIFALAYFQTKRNILALAIGCLFSVAIAFIVSIGFAIGITCFLIGMIFYLYGKKINSITASILLLAGLYLAGIHNTSHSYEWLHGILGKKAYDLISFLCAPLIVYSILMSETVSKILDKKPLVYLGKISFSIYLLHLLVIYLIAMPVYNYLLPSMGFLPSSIISSLLTILFTLLISIPYSNYIDDLSIRVGHKIEKRITSK